MRSCLHLQKTEKIFINIHSSCKSHTPKQSNELQNYTFHTANKHKNNFPSCSTLCKILYTTISTNMKTRTFTPLVIQYTFPHTKNSQSLDPLITNLVSVSHIINTKKTQNKTLHFNFKQNQHLKISHIFTTRPRKTTQNSSKYTHPFTPNIFPNPTNFTKFSSTSFPKIKHK